MALCLALCLAAPSSATQPPSLRTFSLKQRVVRLEAQVRKLQRDQLGLRQWLCLQLPTAPGC